jgi:LCP family protein required for cell wall assembly
MPRRTADGPTKRRKKAAIACTIIGALGGAAVAAGYYIVTRPLHPTARTAKDISVGRSTADPTRRNILLIGTDARPGETTGNTDTLILCSIDEQHRRIEMLSIPRDTKVLYPDGHWRKINESMRRGGPELTMNVVYGLLQQPIDDYVVAHFDGIVQMINTMGGITLYVPERMYYNTGDTTHGHIDLHKGLHKLDGEQALGFVRFRHDALGDIGRTERQQAFLTALIEQLLQPSNLPHLPQLMQDCRAAFDTDLTAVDLAQLASHASEYRKYPIVHETLPGSFHDPEGPGDESYWVVNPEQAVYTARWLFEDGVVQSNPVQDPTVTANWHPPISNSADATGSFPGGRDNHTASPGNP